MGPPLPLDMELSVSVSTIIHEKGNFGNERVVHNTFTQGGSAVHPIPAALLSLAVALGAGWFLGVPFWIALMIGAGSIAAAAVLRSVCHGVERRFRSLHRR